MTAAGIVHPPITFRGWRLFRRVMIISRRAADYFYRVEITQSHAASTLNIPQVDGNDSQSRQYIAVPRGNRLPCQSPFAGLAMGVAI